ncbi:hypothetical protein FG386_003548 [Cryptosporidium ryanae]|uniref:uncharacterized protein n=1 Tax=Cryptosporidium ryanae TaxID=515981 RepID=UPI00351A591A|nr:hypothetical protein FG386_003548 [Cryptosporidium ryanae]
MNTLDLNGIREFSKMFKNISEEYVSSELINIEYCVIKDFMQSFINTESINTEKQRNSHLPKIQYSLAKGDNFNSKFTGGCSSCGAVIDLMFSVDAIIGESNSKTTYFNQKYLRCKMCNFKISKFHSMNFSDSIIYPRTKNALRANSFYVTGIRSSLNFGNFIRSQMKPNNHINVVKVKSTIKNINASNHTWRILDAMQKKKAPKIQEICPECSHNEAFFTQFQARSADEGTTVMYECCRCHHRRIINN